MSKPPGKGKKADEIIRLVANSTKKKMLVGCEVLFSISPEGVRKGFTNSGGVPTYPS